MNKRRIVTGMLIVFGAFLLAPDQRAEETSRKRRKFTKQWTALCNGNRRPIGVLLLHKELKRKQPVYGHPVAWIAGAIAYLDRVPPRDRGESIPHDRFWAVIQDYDTTPEETAAAWQSVAKRGVGAVVFAQTRIDQSFEPRIIPTN